MPVLFRWINPKNILLQFNQIAISGLPYLLVSADTSVNRPL
jgi:hypothetical protein